MPKRAFEAPVLTEDSRFRRRLEAGAYFQRLYQQPPPEAEALQTYFAMEPAVLRVDRIDADLELVHRPRLRYEVPQTLKGIANNSEILGRVRRDTVCDASPPPEHPAARLLAVWTTRGEIPEEDLSIVATTIVQIETIANAEPHPRYDVVITPRRGAEFFPGCRVRAMNPGMYYPSDRFCAVDARLPRDFRIEVIEHEVIHAFCHLHMREDEPCRMITEGLAEYLRFLLPDDEGYEVPPERLTAELAALRLELSILTDPGQMRLEDFLALAPRDFYGLGNFGYLLALACMCYIESRPIEEAFQAKSYVPIERAVRTINTTRFLAFVERWGKLGNPNAAQIVADMQMQDHMLRERTEELPAPTITLGAMGLHVRDQAAAALERESQASAQQSPTLREYFERLLERGAALSLFVDWSAAKMEALTVDPTQGWRFGEEAPVELTPLVAAPSRIRFMRALEQLLETAIGRRVHTEPLSNGLESAGFDFSRESAHYAYTTDLIHLLAKGRMRGGEQVDPRHYVIVIASKDEKTRQHIRKSLGADASEDAVRAALQTKYAEWLEPARDMILSALVVDLAKEEGDALPLARALASLWSAGAPVVYWDPQAPAPKEE